MQYTRFDNNWNNSEIDYIFIGNGSRILNDNLQLSVVTSLCELGISDHAML